MALFSLARRAGSSDFDARRALRPGAFFRLGFLVIRAMDTLPPCRMGAASSWQAAAKRGSDHYIGEAATNDPAAAENEGLRRQVAGREKTKTGAKGRTAYRKFMGDCLKKAPA